MTVLFDLNSLNLGTFQVSHEVKGHFSSARKSKVADLALFFFFFADKTVEYELGCR